MKERVNDRSWMPPTKHELIKALQALKDVAAGNSGLPPSIWRSFILDEDLLVILLSIMQKCWKDKAVPKSWTTMYFNVLAKAGPGNDLSLLKNYRGIAIAEVLSKVYTSILKSRLDTFYESIAPEYCCGFRKGRGRSDSIFAVKQQLRKLKI